MNKYLVPVNMTVYAKDDFHLNKQLNEFLQRSYREFAATYNIHDYEIKNKES